MNTSASPHPNVRAPHVLTLAMLAGLGLPGASLTSHAQDKYPSKPLTIVVPTAPASSTDARARQVAAKLAPLFGQSVVVENKPGAGGIVGIAYLAKLRPDGYAILHSATSNLATAPGMVKALPFDPIQDFAGVTISNEGYVALLTREEYKNLSFPQFLDRMRRNPEQFPIAGTNLANKVFLKQIADAAKIPLTYVPYTDYGRMMNDLWGGRLGGTLGLLNLTMPMVKGGQGHIVAMSSAERLTHMPGMPTTEETLPGVSYTSSGSYFAPARTPRAIVNLLYTQISTVGKDPEVIRRNQEGGRPMFLGPEETDAYMKKEVQRWSALLKESGIVPE